MKFKGLGTALVTPFKNGKVDEKDNAIFDCSCNAAASVLMSQKAAHYC